jgi:hypothetical protein
MLQKFKLLGNLVVRAVLDGRILDIPLSKAFYKIMLEQVIIVFLILNSLSLVLIIVFLVLGTRYV